MRREVHRAETGAEADPGPPGPWPGVRPNFFYFAVASTSGFGSIAEEGLGSIAEEGFGSIAEGLGSIAVASTSGFSSFEL